MVKVYSIIITFNGSKWIKKCLNSLIDSAIQTKIIVVDNNSSDNTILLIQENYNQVEVIKSEKNLGFGKANNIGLAKAYSEGADFVFLLNQDAWIEPDTIESLIKTSIENEKAGIIAPLNFSPEGELESYFQKQLSSENCPGIISDLVTGRLKDYYPVTIFINASCWLISKKCLADIGGFDPVFDHYGEDADYCKRAIYHDFDVVICTSAREFHAKDNYKPQAGKFKQLLSSNITGHLNNTLFVKLKDLNINLISHFIFESITIILLAIKSLLKFSFKYVIIYIIMFLKLQVYFPYIWLNRMKCRKRRPTFLLKNG